MSSEYGIDGCLERMAERIDASEIPVGTGTGRGWGQFLDGPKEHPQVGPYGTCAGVIVRSLAGRQHTGPERRAIEVLHDFLDRYQGGEAEAGRLFSQTLRLAFLVLALRLAEPSSDECKRAEDLLQSRVLAVGAWGDWWIDSDRHDITPRVFVTAIAIICLRVFRQNPPSHPIQESIRRGTEWVLRNIRENPDLPVLVRAAALAAITLDSRSKGWKVAGAISELALTPSDLTSDVGVYFFDYKYLDGEVTKYSRDYFIVPIELLGAISAFSAVARVNVRMRVRATIEQIKKVVMSDGGQYRSNPQQRFSTKNQAWAAIALSFSKSSIESVSALQKFYWMMLRTRDGKLFDKLFPLLAMATTAILVGIAPSDGPIIQKVVIAVAALVIGGLYTADWLRQLVKGRA